MTPASLVHKPPTLLLGRSWPVLVITLIAAALYASTLMVTISGCDHAYCLDAGEFQVALASWGTVHPTGYPLYMLLGSPFVTILRWLGVSPAAGASLFSLLWGLAALAGVTLLLERSTGSPWLSLGGGLLLATLRPFWVHGSLPEVYSLSAALGVAALWLTYGLGERWSDRRGWLLALMLGLGVAHHRLLLLMAPAIAAYLLPAFQHNPRPWRWLGIATACFLAGFAPYVDILVRAWAGSTWLYTQIDSWRDLWFTFGAGEYAGLLRPDVSVASLMSSAEHVTRSLAEELTWPMLAASSLAAGAALWARRTRALALLCMGIVACFALFCLLLGQAVLLEAVLMVPLALLVILLAAGASLAPRPWPTLLGLALIGGAVLLGVRNRPFVQSLTRDPSGLAYIARIEGSDAPPGAVVMAPWGKGYFALSYAQRVEGRLSQWTLVDHRADFDALTCESGKLYTAADTLYVCGLDDFWRPRLGQVYVSSAGVGVIEIARQPRRRDASEPAVSLGDGIAILATEVRAIAPGEMDVVVWWTALAQPSQGYSTFVHAHSDPETIAPSTLLAQSDQSAPVYGWRPTNSWLPDEVVREDHRLTYAASGSAPQRLRIGMYRQTAKGEFEHLGEASLLRTARGWAWER